MARFRVETVTDPETGLIAAEIYFPEHAKEPVAKTASIYNDRDHAMDEIMKLLKEMFSE